MKREKEKKPDWINVTQIPLSLARKYYTHSNVLCEKALQLKQSK